MDDISGRSEFAGMVLSLFCMYVVSVVGVVSIKKSGGSEVYRYVAWLDKECEDDVRYW